MKIYDDIKQIKGIGEKTAKQFNKLNIYTIEDLLRYYPRTYIKYEAPLKLSEAETNKTSAFRLFVTEDFLVKKVRNLSILSGKATDGENVVYITYFNMPYLGKELKKGQYYIFYGKLQFENGRFKLEQPILYKEEQYKDIMNGLSPIYSLTKGLSNKTVTKAIKSAIEEEEYPFLYEEYLPMDDFELFNMVSRKDAIMNIHFPQNEEILNDSRKRLAFDELFIFMYLLSTLKSSNIREKSNKVFIDTALPARIIEQLPYRLTNAQINAFSEIKSDLTGGYIMNRMVQGDVGSGKTILAFLALLLCVDNGYQGALMAPTEILAIQHFENLKEIINKYKLNIRVELLTGSTTVKNKNLIYEDLQSGAINIIIGTHALIQNKVNFDNLGLVVTDEQHRFGVLQRQVFQEKGKKPHILVMSATPIPRSLAMVLYGDMHLTVIDEKPSVRLPIKNCVVGTEFRNKSYELMVREIRNGRQAYIICPMVEESDGLENVENVIDYTKKLKNMLPNDIKVEYLHGQMKPDEKKRIMDAFSMHNIDILVSTTVIEVGIDVPNATVMMIENSERFGLSQLHQLRGRIGRGAYQSYCIFINSDKSGKCSKRLDILNKSNDGFKVAEEDLKLRGAGDLFGIRQSGDMCFEIADIYEDADIILEINKYIEKITTEDPDLRSPKYVSLKNYIDENIDKFIDFGTI